MYTSEMLPTASTAPQLAVAPVAHSAPVQDENTAPLQVQPIHISDDSASEQAIAVKRAMEGHRLLMQQQHYQDALLKTATAPSARFNAASTSGDSLERHQQDMLAMAAQQAQVAASLAAAVPPHLYYGLKASNTICSSSSTTEPASGIVQEDDDGEEEEDAKEEGSRPSSSAANSSTSANNTNGRRKIKIQYIEDKNRRHITFSKRKAGIMKKAYELSTLTGTQVLLLVASETGHVYTFATPKLQPLITRDEGKHLIQSCLNTPDSPQQESVHTAGGPSNFGMDEHELAALYGSRLPANSAGFPTAVMAEYANSANYHPRHVDQQQQAYQAAAQASNAHWMAQAVMTENETMQSGDVLEVIEVQASSEPSNKRLRSNQ